jgi:hyperosmotically inducible protein
MSAGSTLARVGNGSKIYAGEDPMLSRFITTVTVVLAFAAPSFAQSTADIPRGDQTHLLSNINEEVLRYEYYTVFDTVSLQLNGNSVTLLGKVTDGFKKEELGRRIAKVRGVKEVNNQISILPASQSDTALRVNIANAIYRHPTFDRFAGLPNPPIHIIVERGRVTLEGVINNEEERLVAMSIARSSGAFGVTDGLKTVKEAQKELLKR